MKKQTDRVPDEKISTESAAAIAGVNVRTIRRWLDEGLVAFDPVPYGSRILRLVLRASLVQFLASRNKKPEARLGAATARGNVIIHEEVRQDARCRTQEIVGGMLAQDGPAVGDGCRAT